MDWANMMKEYGLVGIMAAANITLLFFIVKWTLSTAKDVLNQMNKERESWIQALNEHTLQAKEFHTSVTEAHKYQREEHKEMIATLGRINGYKKD